MDRIEIEVKLSRDRAWLLETYAALPPDDLLRGVTFSEHDPSTLWTPKDHLAHLAGVEGNFNRMIRRHVDGDANPVGLNRNSDGSPRTRDEIMAGVHRMTEEWVLRHRPAPLADIVALGQRTRAETLALLASLTDAQLAEQLPGAPWADGTVGGVLAVNADHGRVHWRWVKEGLGRPAGS
ncbi:MAG TPA: DinB family protein [Dehalococcoidia bacterium]|nr:DinB family protein [Dehalococcoidia bacterium]